MQAVWIGLAAVHAPLLIRLTVDMITGPVAGDRVASWLVLLVTTAVFTALAVPALARCLGSPRRSFWLLCLATAIVHRGAIGLGPGEPMLPVAVVATTAVVGERLWRPGRRLLRKLRSALAASMPALRTDGVTEWRQDAACCVRRTVRLATAGPRAPPRAALSV